MGRTDNEIRLTGWGEGKMNPSEGGTYEYIDGEWLRTDTFVQKDIPTRGDYAFMRDNNKTIKDYIRYKNPKDREKIKDEFFGKQKEYRNSLKVRQAAYEAGLAQGD